MELKDVLSALRANRWLPVVGLLLGGIAAGLLSWLSAPVYTSSIQFFVSTTGSTSTSEVLQGGQFSQERATSYAELLKGQKLAARVIARLDLAETPKQLTQQLSVAAVPDTVLIDVSVEDHSAQWAQKIAAALGSEFTSYVTTLEKPDESGAAPVQVTVTQDPQVATSPTSPQPVRNTLIGLLGGLVLGGVLAVARDRLDRSVKDAAAASALAGAPVVGVVLRDEALGRHLTIADASTAASEDYRQLRTNLQFLDVDHPPRVIMVSSAIAAEGKSTAVVNLGLALAQAGRRVTIVDADLRRPRIAEYLGLVGDVGLTNLLTGGADIADVLQTIGDRNLSVIAAGPTAPNPGELLASGQMQTLLEKLRGESDFVLVDAPPLLPVADATGLAVHVDGVLLSVRHGRTRRDHLRQSAQTLRGVGARPLGVIMNLVPPTARLAEATGRAHRYGYEVAPQPVGGPRTT